MISGRGDLKKAYQDDEVAREYVGRRFTTPLGRLLHSRQIRVVQQLIRQHAIRRTGEIAPGPARLTVDIAPLLHNVTLIDASARMLLEARRRLGERGVEGRVALVQADAFALPLDCQFDLIYTFRLIRHFERADRQRLYRQVASVLRRGGWLVFDAVNETVSGPLRAQANPGEYAHFDALLRPEPLAAELRECDFDLVSLVGVQRNYPALMRCQVLLAPRSTVLARAAMEIIDRIGGEPLEWVVVCQRV
ncbi:MAG: class I SAM-dependent methyltransferase [Vicinamibacterales bacterium]